MRKTSMPKIITTIRSLILMFEKDEVKAMNYAQKRIAVIPLIDKIKSFDKVSVAEDLLQIKAISDSLSNNLTKLTNAYMYCESWINDIAGKWMKKKNYQAAINIYKLNTELFPASIDACNSLGKAYAANKQNALAKKLH